MWKQAGCPCFALSCLQPQGTRRAPRLSMEWGRRGQGSGDNLLTTSIIPASRISSAIPWYSGKSLFPWEGGAPCLPSLTWLRELPGARALCCPLRDSPRDSGQLPKNFFPSNPSLQTGHEVYLCPKVVSIQWNLQGPQPAELELLRDPLKNASAQRSNVFLPLHKVLINHVTNTKKIQDTEGFSTLLMAWSLQKHKYSKASYNIVLAFFCTRWATDVLYRISYKIRINICHCVGFFLMSHSCLSVGLWLASLGKAMRKP